MLQRLGPEASDPCSAIAPDLLWLGVLLDEKGTTCLNKTQSGCRPGVFEEESPRSSSLAQIG